MSYQLLLFTQYDDNTPKSEPPFSNDASTWDLREDYFLPYGMDDRFRESVLGLTADAQPIGEPAKRGLPRLHHLSCVNQIADEDVKGWIAAAEVKAAMSQAAIAPDDLMPSTRMLVDLIEFLAVRFGADRVRLIFAMFH